MQFQDVFKLTFSFNRWIPTPLQILQLQLYPRWAGTPQSRKHHLQKQEFDGTCNGFQKFRLLPIWLLNPHPNRVSSHVSYISLNCARKCLLEPHISLSIMQEIFWSQPQSAIQESSALWAWSKETNSSSSLEIQPYSYYMIWPYVLEAAKKATCHHPFCKRWSW